MSSFNGRLHMPGYSRIPLVVEVDISDERMTFTSGNREIGDWALRDIAVASKSDGFHIKLEDEEVVLNVTESDRFRSVLGSLVASPRPLASAATMASRGSTSTGNRRGRLSVALEDADFEDVKGRIADLAVAVTSDDVAPSEVFGRWLRLLKEINLRHGQGAMPTPLYYRLNTQLLDLIPEPARPHSTVGR
jgi:hypothetical protein